MFIGDSQKSCVIRIQGITAGQQFFHDRDTSSLCRDEENDLFVLICKSVCEQKKLILACGTIIRRRSFDSYERLKGLKQRPEMIVYITIDLQVTSKIKANNDVFQ